MSGLTPMMAQYMKIKQEYPYCLLFFRLGDFYELFFDDALIASKELELVLTGRDCGQPERAPMCGVPYHAVDGYVARLIEKGHKVAICEQLEDPKETKTIVLRDVVRVVTPGTILDDNVLDQRSNNYIASVCASGGHIGIAAADISTGEFYTYSIGKGSGRLVDELHRINPAEVITADDALASEIEAAVNKRATVRNAYTFEHKAAETLLLNHFKCHTLDGFGITDNKTAVMACGGLLAYLRETQKNALAQISAVKLFKSSEHMSIDAASRRNLELTESLRGRKKEGSLLWALDKTQTAMGARALRRWIAEPLTLAKKIEIRLDAVGDLKTNDFTRDALREQLRGVMDIERLLGRITYGTANARDMIALKRSLSALPEIKAVLAPCKSSMIAYLRDEMDTLPDVHDLLSRSIAEDPPVIITSGGFIKDGYSAELDGYRVSKDSGARLILELEAKERAETGIKNLRIKFNKVFGYSIEVTNSYKNHAPERYKRIQTLSNCERYSTTELKEIEERILTADERIAALELSLWKDIVARITAEVTRIQQAGNTLACLDALQSLAEVAERNRYVRPGINGKGLIRVVEGRHPVVECMLNTPFIPNDTFMNMETDRLLTLTGPNMAGKSTYMRQVALIVLMAQIGSFVPAKEADIGIADKLFTRAGAADDLATGQSTFMVEMAEVSNILHNATQNSLIILDEIGRGTSTYDGMSIAWATLEYIANEKGIGARTLFATHYHEMTELEGKIPGIVNYNVLVRESGENILFLHKIAKGGADKSYGIHVARLAGLPKAVIDRAMTIMDELSANDPSQQKTAGAALGEPVVHYGTPRRKGVSGNRIVIQQTDENTHQLSIRDVFKNIGV